MSIRALFRSLRRHRTRRPSPLVLKTRLTYPNKGAAAGCTRVWALASGRAVLTLTGNPAMAAPDLLPRSQAAVAGSAATVWWVWPLALFVVCFFLGIVAVPAGVGGGVLFVPLVRGFFAFHPDYVRGAGLLVSLSSALAAGPSLLRSGLADMRVALSLALVALFSSIVAALVGLAPPADVVGIALGGAIVAIMLIALETVVSEAPCATLCVGMRAAIAG